MTVRMMELQDGKVIEVGINGAVDRSSFAQFGKLVASGIEAHGTVRLLLEVDHVEGDDPTPSIREVAELDTASCSAFERVALVGDDVQLDWLERFIDDLETAETRRYDKKRITEARQWIDDGLPIVA